MLKYLRDFKRNKRHYDDMGVKSMSYTLKREAIGQGVYFSSITDKKFKHNRITVNFITTLDKETATVQALVPFLLRKGSKSCPETTALERHLCQLYGASVSADVEKFGQNQVLSISIRGIDNRYALEGEDMVAQSARLLADLAFDPKITAGRFDQTDVQLEKAYLADTIAAAINEKRSYAISRCKELMCSGQPIAIPKYGYANKVDAITPEAAATAYKNLEDNAAIEIMFIGSGDANTAKTIFKDLFTGLTRPTQSYTAVPRVPKADTIKEETQTMEINQSKLVMGFRTGSASGYGQTGALRMMAAMYGGTPFSKLFLNVREKLSLCYYCAARYDSATGIMLVDSGVESANKEKAQTEILAQLQALQKGDFSDTELEETRLAMLNALGSIGDSLGGIESWYLSQILLSSNLSPAEEAQNVAALTRKDIIHAAGEITLDTLYFLTEAAKEEAIK